MLRTSLLTGIVLATTMTPAFAYIDPITGSVILQALIGGFAALSVGVRQFREKLFGLFTGRKVAVETQDEDSAK